MKTETTSPESSNIREAEARAEELVRQGQERARQTLDRARQEASQILANAESEAAVRAEMIRKKGLLSIQEEVANALADGRQSIDDLARKTSEHIEDAAGFILRMVTGARE